MLFHIHIFHLKYRNIHIALFRMLTVPVKCKTFKAGKTLRANTSLVVK